MLPSPGGSSAANGPWHVDPELVGRGYGQLVAEVGERHEAVELVVAVGPAAGQDQVEVELGRRALDDHRLSRGRAAHPHRPLTSLSWITVASSGSGSKVSARCHWNRASRMRPTRQ